MVFIHCIKKEGRMYVMKIEAMIDWFNSTLGPYETPRRLIKIEKIVEREDL